MICSRILKGGVSMSRRTGCSSDFKSTQRCPSLHTHCTLMCLNLLLGRLICCGAFNHAHARIYLCNTCLKCPKPKFPKVSRFIHSNKRTRESNRRDLKLGRRGLPVKGNIWRRWPKKLRTLKIDARRCRRTPPQQVMIPLLAVCAREAIRKRADGMY